MKKTYYDKLTAKYEKELMKSLSEFTAINSTYDEETVSKENPFGLGVSHALQYIASLASKDGFEVTNYDNKIVEILYGKGKKNLTILAHADVVPAGTTGWEQDPFTLTEKKGVLYARGVADDKGPLLATYYALKALKDNNELDDGYQIRFLVGGNEESGSLGVEHYFHDLKKPQPTLGFSPDSNFPLIFAEKGIINFKVTYRLKKKYKGFISLKGGTAANAVIDKCDIKCEVNPDIIAYITKNYRRSEALIYTSEDLTTISFLGKSAHGSTPEAGLNAGMNALKALAEFYQDNELMDIVKMYMPLDAKGYKCNAKNKEMGINTSNVGLISLQNGKLEMVVNFRYVNGCKESELIKKIKKVNSNGKVEILSTNGILYFKKDSVLISTLLKSYQDETGDLKSQPLAIGGGTYAKEVKNTVAFGMEFPGWDSHMHSPGESVKRSDLIKAMAIYARAIKDLGERLKK